MDVWHNFEPAWQGFCPHVDRLMAYTMGRRQLMMAVRPMIAFQRFHGMSAGNLWYSDNGTQSEAQNQRQLKGQRILGSPAAMHEYEEQALYRHSGGGAFNCSAMTTKVDTGTRVADESASESTVPTVFFAIKTSSRPHYFVNSQQALNTWAAAAPSPLFISDTAVPAHNRALRAQLGDKMAVVATPGAALYNTYQRRGRTQEQFRKGFAAQNEKTRTVLAHFVHNRTETWLCYLDDDMHCRHSKKASASR